MVPEPDLPSAQQALDALPVPALLLDRERTICFANAAVRRHQADPLCIVISGRRACRFAGAASESLDTVFEHALAGHASVVAATMAGGVRRALWRVSLAPLRSDATRPRSDRGVPAVMLLLEPPLASQRALPALARLYALTAAEVRVLALLLDDRRPKEIARALDIEITTVRSHLKSLFLKTGTRGQGELIGLALSAG